MRIGIDADPIGRNRSGNETYTRGLVSGLQDLITGDDEIVLFGSDIGALDELRDANTRTVQTRPGLVGDLTFGRALGRAGVDVAVASYNHPVGFRGPVATVVHDVAFRRVAETFPRLLRARIGWSVARSVRRSAAIVTVSEFSRAELLDLYPKLDPAALVVTLNAPSPVFSESRSVEELAAVRARYELPDEFILAVGNVQPRKNLRRLAEAASRIDVPLVIVGQPLWKSAEVIQAFGSQTKWLGYVSTAELACLYRLCTVFAYPSLYEGFGLPVVEAMAAGAPVITSTISALPEAAGGAAVLVDPLDVGDIARGLTDVLSARTRRAEMVDAGRTRASLLTWPASAGVLLRKLRELR